MGTLRGISKIKPIGHTFTLAMLHKFPKFMKTTCLSLSFLMVVVSACVASATIVQDLIPLAKNAPTRSIYLVNQGWHAGIIVKRADIPDGVWLEHKDLPDSEYLEVGWGDRDYYQDPGPHFGITLKAALWPTESVLHIATFNGSVTGYFVNREIIKIELSEPGFEKLCRYFSESYAKDDAGQAIPLRPGLYGKSRFYLSRETYHVFKTCNVWTARGLRAAGLPIASTWTIQVDSLMSEARALGTLVQSEPVIP